MRRQIALFLGILMCWLAFCGMAMASGILVKEGVRGDDVRRVQLLLISRGYLTGEADGVCGKATVKAIEQFQREAGLEADGICGQETFDLLEKQAKEREAAETEEVPVGGVVKLGLHGPGVFHVQELLMAKGYLSGTADGVCGSQTAGAIARFQEEMGLKADGVCGSMTYAALAGDTPGDVEQSGQHEESGQPDEEAIQQHAGKGHVVYVLATGYSAYDPGNYSHTASGTLVRKGVIAVDPSFIPLGTRVYIPGYGEAVAEDVGLDIRGNRIDVAFDTREEAMVYGRQDVELYIIE